MVDAFGRVHAQEEDIVLGAGTNGLAIRAHHESLVKRGATGE